MSTDLYCSPVLTLLPVAGILTLSSHSFMCTNRADRPVLLAVGFGRWYIQYMGLSADAIQFAPTFATGNAVLDSSPYITSRNDRCAGWTRQGYIFNDCWTGGVVSGEIKISGNPIGHDYYDQFWSADVLMRTGLYRL